MKVLEIPVLDETVNIHHVVLRVGDREIDCSLKNSFEGGAFLEVSTDHRHLLTISDRGKEAVLMTSTGMFASDKARIVKYFEEPKKKHVAVQFAQ